MLCTIDHTVGAEFTMVFLMYMLCAGLITNSIQQLFSCLILNLHDMPSARCGEAGADFALLTYSSTELPAS